MEMVEGIASSMDGRRAGRWVDGGWVNVWKAID